ncbi:MAG: SMC-Scp complex subunit ScpB [Chitinivibrionales bacterium]|nr:SMC-Scp complex subunit ScpB [Chitinivibrionales bacterium]
MTENEKNDQDQTPIEPTQADALTEDTSAPAASAGVTDPAIGSDAGDETAPEETAPAEGEPAASKKGRKSPQSIEDSEAFRVCEALIFASDEPLSLARLKTIVPGQPDARDIRRMVDAINVQLQVQRHPFEIVELAGGFQFRTVPYYQAWVRQLFTEKASRRLSVQTLETLAIIAYKPNITKAEIEAIRGVECDGAMKTLLERRLITITGRSEKPGRPLLYGTTNDFLIYFGLNALGDLPNIEEFEALARDKLGDMSEVMLEEEVKTAQTENPEIAEIINPENNPDGKGTVPAEG